MEAYFRQSRRRVLLIMRDRLPANEERVAS